MPLVLTLSENKSLIITAPTGEQIRVQFNVRVKGRKRCVIDAPRSFRVQRGEALPLEAAAMKSAAKSARFTVVKGEPFRPLPIKPDVHGQPEKAGEVS